MTTARLEAFSDGVIAILITIMVLELKVPHGADLESIKPLLPVFCAYVLSFIYIAIYWNNHPRWDDFMRVRAELDPLGLFINEHFRSALGLDDGPLSIHADEPSTPDGTKTMTTPNTTSLPISAKLRAFYEDLAIEREGALAQIDDLFTEDLEFRDPFRHTHGLKDFRVLFERMLKQYNKVGFNGWRTIGTDDAFSMTYEMHLQMPVGPDFVTRMCSVCTTRDGKISQLHDYYDFASALVSPMELAARGYRWVTNRLFL